jgi:hypothetical protein
VAVVFLGEIRPVPPAPTPDDSMAVWIVLAVVLALIVASGMFLTSRR